MKDSFLSAGLEFWCFVTLISIFGIALLSSVLFPLLRSGLNMLRPAVRANVLLAWCVAPIVLGILVSFAPLFLGVVGLAPADCGRISDVFLVGRALPLIFDAVLLVPFVWFVFSSTLHVRAAIRFSRKIDSLIAVGMPVGDGDVIIVDSTEPLAFASGLYRSQIIIASCLQRSLTSTQMQAVLAHERAHVRRHDTLRYLIAEVASVAHLPWVGSSLLADLHLATEQACDEAAVQAGGDRIGVAATLLRVERLFGRRSGEFTVLFHFLGGNLEARVEALLAGGQCAADRWRRVILAGSVFCGVVVIISALPLHQLMGAFLIYFQS